jgi:hypothetical protein
MSQDIQSIEHDIDIESTDKLVQYLESGKIKNIQDSSKINKLDRKKFEPYKDYSLVRCYKNGKFMHCFYKKSDKYVHISLYNYQEYGNDQLETFTSELENIQVNKKENEFKRLKLEVNMTEKTKEYEREIDEATEAVKKIKKEEKKLIDKRTESEQSFEQKLNELYNKKMSYIQKNKNLYRSLKKIATDFHSKPDEEKNHNKYSSDYKKILDEIQNNKDSVLELLDEISLLEKKSALYKTSTFVYNKASGLVISEIDKEQFKRIKKEVKKSMGKKEKEEEEDEEEHEFDDNSESTEASKKSKKSSKKGEVKSKSDKKKKGGDLYDLEYVDMDIPEQFSVAVERNFDKIKRDIKKKSKVVSKNDLLKQFNLFRNKK